MKKDKILSFFSIFKFDTDFLKLLMKMREKYTTKDKVDVMGGYIGPFLEVGLSSKLFLATEVPPKIIWAIFSRRL